MGLEPPRTGATAAHARRCPHCGLEAPGRHKDIGFDLHSYECLACGCAWMTDRRTGGMVGHLIPTVRKNVN